MNELELPALDGANPLGFLAALGTLAVLADSDPTIKLGWKSKARWTPFLASTQTLDESAVLSKLAPRLRGRTVGKSAQEDCAKIRKEYRAARKALNEAKKALSKQGLRGKERAKAYEESIRPLETAADMKRRDFLEKLNAAVPSLELSVGDKIDMNAAEFREKAREFLDDHAAEPLAVQMLACFASEQNDGDRCRRTEFDFVDSSGQLAFLKAARELSFKVTGDKLRRCLFEGWRRDDEELSLRFDPVEDRRYALLDRDPTANNNKSRSEWMANLLAYHAIRFFPCTLTASGPATGGWSVRTKQRYFTWPIWLMPLGTETLRSLLGMEELQTENPPAILRRRGIAAIYRSLRVENGDYVNFSPASAVL